MKLKMILPGLGLLLLGACATAPSPNSLAGIPVIEFGNATPAHEDFILHFPAGKDIPTDILIDGDIFQQASQQVMTVKLRREIYSYKNWLSYDGQHWHSAQDELGMMLDIKIPSHEYPQRGHIKLNLSEKK